MKNVKIDDNGDARCWKCGGKSFKQKRTMRSKVIGGGVGSLLTKQKLRCNNCGKFNDVG